mgnify:CR=1 FL=1
MSVAKERGILFSGEMVRAVLAGVKQRTRRTAKAWLRVKKGDRLWVRETFHPCDGGAIFAADYPYEDLRDAARAAGVERWKPSIFLPRAESRIDLVAIADAYEEPLHAITEAEAQAEGVRPEFEIDLATFVQRRTVPPSTFVLGFKHAWNRINGPKAWSANPSVVVVSFERVRP